MLQITSLYGGPMEFLFVVESTEDPAYHAVKRLLNDYKVCSFLQSPRHKIECGNLMLSYIVMNASSNCAC